MEQQQAQQAQHKRKVVLATVNGSSHPHVVGPTLAKSRADLPTDLESRLQKAWLQSQIPSVPLQSDSAYSLRPLGPASAADGISPSTTIRPKRTRSPERPSRSGGNLAQSLQQLWKRTHTPSPRNSQGSRSSQGLAGQATHAGVAGAAGFGASRGSQQRGGSRPTGQAGSDPRARYGADRLGNRLGVGGRNGDSSPPGSVGSTAVSGVEARNEARQGSGTSGLAPGSVPGLEEVTFDSLVQELLGSNPNVTISGTGSGVGVADVGELRRDREGRRKKAGVSAAMDVIVSAAKGNAGGNRAGAAAAAGGNLEGSEKRSGSRVTAGRTQRGMGGEDNEKTVNSNSNGNGNGNGYSDGGQNVNSKLAVPGSGSMDPLLADLLEEAIDEPVELQLDSSAEVNSTEMNSADTSSAGQGLTGGGTSMDFSTDSGPESSLDASVSVSASAGASAGNAAGGIAAGLSAFGSGGSSLGIADLGLNGGSGLADLGVEEFLRGLDGLDNAFVELEDMFPMAPIPTLPPAAAAGGDGDPGGGGGGNVSEDMLVDVVEGMSGGAGGAGGAGGLAGGSAGAAGAAAAGVGAADADMVAFVQELMDHGKEMGYANGERSTEGDSYTDTTGYATTTTATGTNSASQGNRAGSATDGSCRTSAAGSEATAPWSPKLLEEGEGGRQAWAGKVTPEEARQAEEALRKLHGECTKRWEERKRVSSSQGESKKKGCCCVGGDGDGDGGVCLCACCDTATSTAGADGGAGGGCGAVGAAGAAALVVQDGSRATAGAAQGGVSLGEVPVSGGGAAVEADPGSGAALDPNRTCQNNTGYTNGQDSAAAGKDDRTRGVSLGEVPVGGFGPAVVEEQTAPISGAAIAAAAGASAAAEQQKGPSERKGACCVGPDSWGECAKKGDPIALLVSVAKAIVTGDQTRVHQLLSNLNEVASVYGTVTQRLSAYFLEGLIARVAGAPPKHSTSLFDRFDSSSGVLAGIGGEGGAGGGLGAEEEACRGGTGDGAGFGRMFADSGGELGGELDGFGGPGEMVGGRTSGGDACGAFSQQLLEEGGQYSEGGEPFEQRQEAGELTPGEAALIPKPGALKLGELTGVVAPASRGAAVPAAPQNVDCNRSLLESFQVLVNATPFLTFGQVAANSAILEAVADEPRVHIIDFGIGHALQWPALLQALGARPGGPPHVRMTGIEVPQCGAMSPYCAMKAGKRLEMAAAMWGVPLQYHWVMSRLEDVTPAMLNLRPGEAVAANCALRLSQLLDESEQPNAAANPATAASAVFAKPAPEPDPEADRAGADQADLDGSYLGTADLDSSDSDSSPRMRVLRTIRMLRPKVVTVVEQYSNHSSPFFLARFYEALYYYAALFESIDASLPRDEVARRVFEEQVGARPGNSEPGGM
ncbi:hypothetical protein CLOM_g9971 [Closterium sp. NIES-68]|nr:hypothetical protein CLOM_g9971 [Closterium sp. NIES-68]GJP68429.1 hypothetical protein CLOP_g25139 [Closterium sp. NIES-67]